MSSSNHEKYLLNNTLACVASLCVGKVTTVELRNEAHVTGRVVQVRSCRVARWLSVIPMRRVGGWGVQCCQMAKFNPVAHGLRAWSARLLDGKN